jgi:site-specific DNA-methyltransferase (adenine-specific)
MKYQIIQGDNREALRTLADNSIDAIVTDPPYGIDFLGKDWDANTGALETYQECLRVLKPGGHILAFSAARTYHHLAVTLEAAGFEIRDQIMWIYSSGFPKSQGVKTHPGWGTSLKPAHEPIALARKPTKLSIKANMLQHNIGGLNIDATRVPFESEDDKPSGGENGWSRVGFSEQPVEKYKNQKKKKSDIDTYLNNKRGPMERAKIADGENIGMFDGGVGYKAIKRKVDPVLDLPEGRFPSNVLGEIAEPYQKYFYCPKVSRRERHIGYVDLDTSTTRDLLILVDGKYVAEDGTLIDAETTGSCPGKMVWLPGVGKIFAHGLKHEVETILKATGRESEIPKSQGNNHPTVKPIELMKYLIRLITPPGGTVLDPFNGSGSTGCAAVELGYEYIGCELDPAYVDIARKRIEAWYAHTHPLQATGLFE